LKTTRTRRRAARRAAGKVDGRRLLPLGVRRGRARHAEPGLGL